MNLIRIIQTGSYLANEASEFDQNNSNRFVFSECSQSWQQKVHLIRIIQTGSYLANEAKVGNTK